MLKHKLSFYSYLKEKQLSDVLLVSLPLLGFSDCRNLTKGFIGNVLNRKQNDIFIDFQIFHVLLMQ